jgi:hypothetical protein
VELAARVWQRRKLFALGLLILLAAFLRFHQLDSIPVGLDVDEAVDGWEARRILSGGCCPIFFTADYGEEPMHIYVVALLFRLFSPGVFYVRAASAIAGLLLVPVIYLLARELLPPSNRSRGGLVPILSAFWVATSYWHITYSRAGMEPVSLPLLISTATFFLWRGIRLQKRSAFLLSGCFLGASMYTYRAVRFFLLFLLLFLGYQLLTDARFRQTHLRNLMLLGATFTIVFLPLGSYALSHPDTFFKREMTVTILRPGWDDRPPPVVVFEGIAKTFGMYNIVPDPQFERNPAHRPILDPVSSVFFLIGLTSAWLRRREPPYAFVFLWLPVMSLPGALTPDVAPQYSRAMGALPAVAMLFALGVDYSKNWLRDHRVWPTVRYACWPLLGLALFMITLFSYRHYFTPWLQRQREGIVNGARDIEAAGVMNTAHVPGGVWILPVSSVDTAGLPPFQVYFLYEGHLPYHTLRVDEMSCAQELSDACEDHSSALVVNWTDFVLEKAYESENSDPKGLIDFLLTKYGGRIDTEPFQSFDLIAYELPDSPDFFIARSYEPLAVNFADQLRLVGLAFGGSSLHPTSTTEEVERKVLPSGKEAWVVLQWQAINAPSANYKVAVYLLDGQGRLIGQVDKMLLSNHLRPTSDWTVGQMEIDYYNLPSMPATPPGEYTIWVTVYDPETMERLTVLDERTGTAASSKRVGSLQVIKPLTPPQVEPMERLEPSEEQLAPDIQLLGYDLPATVVRPGQAIAAALYWQALEDIPHDYTLSLQLRDSEGQIFLEQLGRPADDTYPTTNWEEGEVLRDWHDLPLPADIPQGEYELFVSVLEGEELVGQASLGQIKVRARARQFTAPEIQHPMQASLGESVLFLGHDLGTDQLRAGEPIQLILYWQALQEMQVSYTVFTHLLDADKRIWGQMDSIPQLGEAPTTGWVAKEVITDHYEIFVDTQAPAGTYAVEIGMYDGRTGHRLPVLDAQGQAIGDAILLQSIRVLAAEGE